MTGRKEREYTSLTPAERSALAELAETAGLPRSALLRLLALDGLRRYSPGGLVGTPDREARAARIRLEGIKAEEEAAQVRPALAAY